MSYSKLSNNEGNILINTDAEFIEWTDAGWLLFLPLGSFFFVCVTVNHLLKWPVMLVSNVLTVFLTVLTPLCVQILRRPKNPNLRISNFEIIVAFRARVAACNHNQIIVHFMWCCCCSRCWCLPSQCHVWILFKSELHFTSKSHLYWNKS